MASSSRSSLPASTSNVITVASSATGGSTSDSAAGGVGTGTGSPCAACKFLRRKCQPDCVFAPYFPPDNPQKFVQVHRVFGASNVTKILNDLHPKQREDAVNSLAYEADMRIRDPIYGCVGVISVLQHRLRQLQEEVYRTSIELAKYKAAAASAAVVGSNYAPAHMGDFVGNPVPNCTQSFVNMGHSTAAAIGGAGFMQHDQFPTVMLTRSYYDGEAATARIGVNGGGGHGFGYSSALGDAEQGGLGSISAAGRS